VERDRRNGLHAHRLHSAASAAAGWTTHLPAPATAGPEPASWSFLHRGMMPEKCPKRNLDPSRCAVLGVGDRNADGHGDQGGLRDSAGGGSWPRGAAGVAPRCGRLGCNTAGRDRSRSKSRTTSGIPGPGKRAVGGARGWKPPCPLEAGLDNRQPIMAG